MSRSVFPIRIAGVVGLILALAVIVVSPVGAMAPQLQATPEPGTRPPPTAAPYIEVNPTEGIAGNANQTTVTGYFFTPNGALSFTLDGTAGMAVVGSISWNGSGSFTAVVQIPREAQPGAHTIAAIQGGGAQGTATYTLIAPTPTNTATPTHTPTATLSPTPQTPTLTPTATGTSSPTPTLAPITPMTTITPLPATTRPPSAATNAPARTKTPTPIPGTATFTPTPSTTPTITNTPGPGTPSVTPLPTSAPTTTPTPVGEISETGSGVGTMFLWGFVLAGLVVVFRVLRVKSLQEPN
jgi:hypothetical protein